MLEQPCHKSDNTIKLIISQLANSPISFVCLITILVEIKEMVIELKMQLVSW